MSGDEFCVRCAFHGFRGARQGALKVTSLMAFPDLANYRILLVDDRAETTAMIAAIFAPTGAGVTVAGTSDVGVGLICRLRPDVVMLATAIAGEPFAVVEAARHHGVPILGLDLGSAGPEISDRLARQYGVAVLRNVDDPEGLCHAAKRAADEAARRGADERVGELRAGWRVRHAGTRTEELSRNQG